MTETIEQKLSRLAVKYPEFAIRKAVEWGTIVGHFWPHPRTMEMIEARRVSEERQHEELDLLLNPEQDGEFQSLDNLKAAGKEYMTQEQYDRHKTLLGSRIFGNSPYLIDNEDLASEI